MSTSAKLSARDRIFTLVDDNSFVEIGALVTKRSTDFNLASKEAPSDGVITGYGLINGNPVYIYSQDAAVLSGSMGEMHAKKICNMYDMAMKMGAPVIGLIDCAGLRVEEATDALEGLGEIYFKQTMASGVIPQIAAVFGSCGGGLSVSASMCDFVFVESKNGKIFVNHPNAVEGNNVDKCDTSAAAFKAESGTVDFVGEDEVAMINQIRDLVSIIPGCSSDDCTLADCEDDLNRLVPEFAGDLDDITVGIRDLSDGGFFVEAKAGYAKEMVTGFIKLNGATVGVIANRAAINDEKGKVAEKLSNVLTTAGCRKAEKFVSFCDSFDIPVLTLSNVTGYNSSKCSEKGLSAAVAKFTYAYANATVPKVTLVTKKAYGSAYVTMGSKALGADLVFALENAEIGMMEDKLAAQIVYADELKGAKDGEKALAEKAALYSEQKLAAASAAKRGYVDSIIEASEARKNLIYAFEMLYLKDEERPVKKHGTV